MILLKIIGGILLWILIEISVALAVSVGVRVGLESYRDKNLKGEKLK